MAQKTNSFERFWKELKRRKVIHVITVYAAVSFVILQLVDIVERPLRLPDWTTALVIVLLCIGFIIAVFLSWVYDITPAGVKKTKPVSAIKHSNQATTPTSNGWKIATYISVVVIIVLLAFNFLSRRNLNSDISKLDKSIAVLPFINDSPGDSNNYVINGLWAEVTNNLQTIKNLRVLSRTSTDQYRGSDRPAIPEIAKKLDVNYIVEASGQMIGSILSVRVLLTKAKGKETPIWAKHYEEEMKEVRDWVRIQSQIAQAITAEVKATITPEEKQLIEKVPTTNLTAYDFYQRGREEHFGNLNIQYISGDYLRALKKAENYYHKALECDSTFALAYAGLALIYNEKHTYTTDTYFSENYLDSTKILADKALIFDDKLAEAYDARGIFYKSKGFTKQAIEEYDKALRYNPNDWMAYFGKGELYTDDDLIQSLKNLNTAASLIRESKQLPMLLRYISYVYDCAGFFDTYAVVSHP